METHPASEFDRRGLVLRGPSGSERLDFFCAEMHYWRVPRSSWSACLAAIANLGFEIVSTFVPWSVHDTGPGAELDFTGGKDLPAFVEQAAEAGLKVVLKPGPNIGAELTHFGYPQWLLQIPEALAVTGRGTPAWMPTPPHMFPVPSYASTVFREHANRWLAGFAETVAAHCFPLGPVVAFQVDNQTQQFFRMGAFDVDYHPDALSWWRSHSGYESAPVQWDSQDRRRCLEWTQFQEVYAQGSLEWISSVLVDGGLGHIARFHSAPPSVSELIDLPGASEAISGPAGQAFHHRARDYSAVRSRALYLSGSAKTLPIATEVGLGGPPWLPPADDHDCQQVVSGILAGGVRGLNFYMTVERERWYGAPIDSSGVVRESAQWVGKILAGLRQVEWTELSRKPAVAVVVSRAEARVARATSVADPLSPVVANILGLGVAASSALATDEPASQYPRWVHAVESALDLAGIEYHRIDENAPDDSWSSYAALVCPTTRRIDSQLLAQLCKCSAAGARVVLGPVKPDRDQYDAPLTDRPLPKRLGLMRSGSLDDLPSLAADLRRAANVADRGEPATSEDCSPVHVSRYYGPEKSLRLVAIGNPTAVATVCKLPIAEAGGLKDLITGEVLMAEGECISVTVGESSVRLLTVVPTP